MSCGMSPHLVLLAWLLIELFAFGGYLVQYASCQFVVVVPGCGRRVLPDLRAGCQCPSLVYA